MYLIEIRQARNIVRKRSQVKKQDCAVRILAF